MNVTDRDLLVATDDERYKTRTLGPLVPLSDGAGVIESVNPAPGTPSRWKAGDRVITAAMSSWKSAEPGTDAELDPTVSLGAGDVGGVLQQYFVADEDAVVPAPEGLAFEEAAALGGAYVSAWNALFGWYRPLRAGDVVVTQGTGGVSTAVLQVSSYRGFYGSTIWYPGCSDLTYAYWRIDSYGRGSEGDRTVILSGEARGCEAARRGPRPRFQRPGVGLQSP